MQHLMVVTKSSRLSGRGGGGGDVDEQNERDEQEEEQEEEEGLGVAVCTGSILSLFLTLAAGSVLTLVTFEFFGVPLWMTLGDSHLHLCLYHPILRKILNFL